METEPVDRVEQQNKEMEPADRTGWTVPDKETTVERDGWTTLLKRRQSNRADRDKNDNENR